MLELLSLERKIPIKYPVLPNTSYVCINKKNTSRTITGDTIAEVLHNPDQMLDPSLDTILEKYNTIVLATGTTMGDIIHKHPELLI